jgi:HAD superfamily hydrolase (TIGR01490 family)
METIFSEGKNLSESYIAFFDLDLTITDSVSGRELAKTAFKKGYLKWRALGKAIILSLLFRMKLMDQLKIIDEMISWVKGISEDSISDLCLEVSRNIILPSVHKDAITEIQFHRSENARVVILSSALAPICSEVAGYLKIDDFICSELEVKDGHLTGRPSGRLCFGEEKARRLKDYCSNNNAEITDSWYYGDSESDIPPLSIVGHPVCVNPDKILRKTARERGWEIRSWAN